MLQGAYRSFAKEVSKGRCLLAAKEDTQMLSKQSHSSCSDERASRRRSIDFIQTARGCVYSHKLSCV